jgi:dTDP-glucose 4,6-dehydratase
LARTILVTGGAGFIGSNFVHHLYDTYPDYRILVLDALTYAGSLENLPAAVNHASGNGRLQFWYGDVRNASLVDSLVEQSDVVVHFAAETHVTRSIYDNYHFFETDVLGTQVVANSVLKHVKHVDRFIHISTSEVYGTARAPRMDEEAPLMPMSPYASAKAGADRLVYSYFATYNLPAIIVRHSTSSGRDSTWRRSFRVSSPAACSTSPSVYMATDPRNATSPTSKTPAGRSIVWCTATGQDWWAK